MKKLFLIFSCILPVGLFSQNQTISAEKKIVITENSSAGSEMQTTTKIDGASKITPAEKGSVNIPEAVDTRTTGTISNKKNSASETEPKKQD